MVKANLVIDFAKKMGADLAGIAPVDRFQEAPEGHRPEDLLPGARSVVALAMRIPLTIVRRIPGGYYDKFGYHDLNAHLRKLTYKVALFLEDQGYEAFPVDPSVEDKSRRVDILAESPEPKIKVWGDFSHRHAAVAAGLGEIGASCMVVVPKFGPRVRVVSVITSAPIEARPQALRKEKFRICEPEKCGLQCAKKCPAKALPGDGTIDHFKCRNFRNPGYYTLEYFKEIAAPQKGSSSRAKAPAPAVTQSCGLCIKVCPIGLSL